jgi:hypothetical protein
MFWTSLRSSQVRCEVQKCIIIFTNQFVNYALDWLLLLQGPIKDFVYKFTTFTVWATCTWHVVKNVNNRNSSDYGSRKQYNAIWNSNMVATKICAWGTCKNDSGYPHLYKRNKNNDPIQFYHFPWLYDRQKGDIKWIIACHRDDNFVCTKDSYICSLHFISNNGLTAINNCLRNRLIFFSSASLYSEIKNICQFKISSISLHNKNKCEY